MSVLLDCLLISYACELKYETTYMSGMVLLLVLVKMETGDLMTSETMRGGSQMLGGASNLPHHYPKTQSRCQTGTHFCVPVDVCVPLDERESAGDRTGGINDEKQPFYMYGFG
jgi:hypothetical protein